MSRNNINFDNLVNHDLTKEKSEKIVVKDTTFEPSHKVVALNPLQNKRKAWDILLSVLLIYNMVEIPITIAFSMPAGRESGVFWVNRVVDLFFIADLFLNFETGIYAGEKIIMDKDIVRMQYLMTWFSLDVMASLPFDLLACLIIIDSSGSEQLRSTDGPILLDALTAVQFLKFLRMLKILKCASIFENYEKALVFRYEDLGVVRFLLFICFCLHWSACIFSWLDINVCLQGDEYSSFVSSGLDDEGRSTKYLAALYWAFATMTTIGYGDISASCSATRGFSLIVMLVASIVYAYGLSYVMEVLRNKRKSEAEFRDLMDMVNKYMAFRKIPKDLREEIRKFFNYVSESDAKKNELLSERVILEELSPELRVAVLCHVNSGLLEKVPLFNQIQECVGAQSSILQDVVLHMRSQVFRPYEVVLKEGNTGNELFFVTSGSCVQLKWNRITVNVITVGEYYGEGGFLFDRLHHSKSQVFGMTVDDTKDTVSDLENTASSMHDMSSAAKRALELQGMQSVDGSGFANHLDLTNSHRTSSGTALKRHTFAPDTSGEKNDRARPPQRNSNTISDSSMIKSSNLIHALRNAPPYSQRYSLVTQSYSDLRYITREMFDTVVGTLPRNKVLKIHRLMHRRFEEVDKLQKERDAELERLYPEIKAEFESLHEHEVDLDDEEDNWRNQEGDFVDEEVKLSFDNQDGSKAVRRGSKVATTPLRRNSITALMSPRKKQQPHHTSPRKKSAPPQYFNFPSPRKKSIVVNAEDKAVKPDTIRKSHSLSSTGRKKPVDRLASGTLRPHDNSISALMKQESFSSTSPIYQSSVPTSSINNPYHSRLFERAMSLRQPTQDSSDDDSSVYSLQSFDDQDTIISPANSEAYSRGMAKTTSGEHFGTNDHAIESLDSIEKNITALYKHVITLKKEMSQKSGLSALAEVDEKSDTDSDANIISEEELTPYRKDSCGLEDQDPASSAGSILSINTNV